MRNLMYIILLAIGLIACLKDDESTQYINTRELVSINTDSIYKQNSEGISNRAGLDTFLFLQVGSGDDVGLGGVRDFIVFNHSRVDYYLPTAIPGGQAQNEYLARVIIKFKDSTEYILQSAYVQNSFQSGVKYKPTFINIGSNAGKVIVYNMLTAGATIRYNENRGETYPHNNYRLTVDKKIIGVVPRTPRDLDKQWKPRQTLQ